MLCPLDQTELKRANRKGIDIDYCPKCRGIWLDRGELDKLIQIAQEEVADKNPPEGSWETKRVGNMAGRVVPLDGNRAEERIAARNEVRDAEFRDLENTHADRVQDDEDPGQRKATRRNWFEELFDFG